MILKSLDEFPKTVDELDSFIYTHLIEQGGPARPKEWATCEYRTEDGRACAVGCLIPDALYNPSFEGLTIVKLFAYKLLPSELETLFTKYLSRLQEWQNYHDRYIYPIDTIESWAEYLNRVTGCR